MFSQLLNISNYYFNPYAVPVLLVSIFIFFTGAFVLRQNKSSILNIAFFLECFSVGFWLFTISFMQLSHNPHVAHTWYKYFTFFGVVNIIPSVYLFSVVWSGFLKRQKIFIPIVYLIFFFFYGLAIGTNELITQDVPRYFWGFYPRYGPLGIPFIISVIVIYGLALFNVYAAYRQEEVAIKKAQKGMMVLIFLVGFTGPIDFIPKLFCYEVYPIAYIFMFIYIVLVAYSIVRYRAFDIETALHKTALWLLTFSFIIFPVFFLYRWFLPYIKESNFLQFVFWTVSFLIFAFYLRIVQPKIDHLFQRRESNLEEILNKFVEDLVYLKGMDNLIERIEDTIADTLYPQQIDIFIYNEDKKRYTLSNIANRPQKAVELKEDNNFLQWLTGNNKIIYKEFIYIDPQYAWIREEAQSYFELTNAIVIIPLVLNAKLLGVINLGKKANFRRYRASEFRFLNTLKNESVIALSNSLLYENMEQQVKQRSKELVEVQKQLIQAEKLATVGTLAGGVAHEINNPLTAILTNVQMLLFDDEDAKVDRESLEIIEEATRRCKSIVEKLMTYARKPLEVIKISTVNCLDIIKNVLSLIGYQLEQENIKIVSNCNGNKFLVSINQNEIEQVITNIILNGKDAIKKVKKFGRINITLSQADTWLIINIEDDGEGMDEETLSKIFDPFFTTKDVGKGLGLGLSICHKIIEDHGGRIDIKSKQNQGSTFSIKLPLAKEE